MHEFCRAQNRIDRASRDAFCAADTVVFDNERDLFGLVLAELRIERLGRYAQQTRDLDDAFVAAGRALIDVGHAISDGLGVRLTAFEAALAALGLRQ